MHDYQTLFIERKKGKKGREEGERREKGRKEGQKEKKKKNHAICLPHLLLEWQGL